MISINLKKYYFAISFQLGNILILIIHREIYVF
jgi:hypothetical protein